MYLLPLVSDLKKIKILGGPPDNIRKHKKVLWGQNCINYNADNLAKEMRDLQFKKTLRQAAELKSTISDKLKGKQEKKH